MQNEIASGGMGVVYRVIDRTSGEQQALKRVTKHGGDRQSAIEALAREYQVLSSLDHPRIIRVFDYGVDEAGPYYTMELLEGQDMRQAAPLPFRRACGYLRDIATSLALLHGRQLLHRDLSPTNVRVTADGHCKLLDFGALTPFGATTHLVGTPPLIAPESLLGEQLDQRTDLYSLGALAYWLVTGRHAFPVRALSELASAWAQPPLPPSVHTPELPPELDALVLALLSRDPLARPSSAAEVISRLQVIGQLEPEDSALTARLTQSFFTSPRFTGRSALLLDFNRAIESALHGRGATLCIESLPGMGRTRLLEEVSLRAQLAGATVLFTDASMSRRLQASAQALVQRAFELLPERAHQLAPGFRSALAALEPIAGVELAAPLPGAPTNEVPRPLAEFFAELSQARPLVIAIDNLEDADDASHGLFASLASLADRYPLLLVVSEARASTPALGSIALRRHAQPLVLDGLASAEMTELVRSIFADAPNVERFADWLQERSAGSPLHAIEICRRLLAKDVIRYASGLWTLPVDRPDGELPAALGDALSLRLGSLSEAARMLCECLCLQRDQPTLRLCALLCADAEQPEARARALLDELTHTDVLHAERGVYRFTSAALRGALAHGLRGERLEANHHRLGEAFSRLAGADLCLRIEAGFHLIEGGDELRGAALIATATHDSVRFRQLIANLYHAGQPVETALKVYRRHRRSAYERLPLLGALAQCGYYEARYFGEEYGDDALDTYEELSGLATARRLRKFVGRALALVLGVLFAYLRFCLAPRRERRYSFRELMLQLFAAVSSLTGTAALSLDALRASKVAEVLEPFAVLPERLTPVGIYQFCTSLSEIARENEVTAYATFEQLLRRFSDRRWYPSLPQEARQLYIAGLHFARGSFALFRADGRPALESADALEATGFKLYAMIASQLRHLYYCARGEFAKGAPHRDQVELHAAHMGSVWQVETWEAAALILIYAVSIGEVVGTTRIVHRLEAVSRSVPSLKNYSSLAALALVATQLDPRYVAAAHARYASIAPRAFIGWAATVSVVVRLYNHIGEFAQAKAVGELAMQSVTYEDRELVALFLPLDIQLAYADAGLGNTAPALTRIDGLLQRFSGCDHPLALGMLHEARAYICWGSKRFAEYNQSVSSVERWYRSTGTPALVAKCERLSGLGSNRRSALPPLALDPLTTDAPTTLTAIIDVRSRQA